MTVYLRDEFTDPNGTQLDVHTPAPTADPGRIWEYVTAGAAPYGINGNAVNDEGTGIANAARVDQVILDDLIQITGEVQRAGPLTLAQTGQLHICMEEIAMPAEPGRLTVLFDNSQIKLQAWDDAGSGVTLGNTSDPRDPDIKFVIGMSKAGDQIKGWAEDIGGGNRVDVSATLTPTQQSLYEDGAHRMAGITTTGTMAGHYKIDVMQVEDFLPNPAQSAAVDYEFNILIPVSQTAIVDYEQILRIAVSQSEIIDYELGAPLIFVSQQVVINHEVSILKKLFCPEPAALAIVTTCPTAKTIKCSG